MSKVDDSGETLTRQWVVDLLIVLDKNGGGWDTSLMVILIIPSCRYPLYIRAPH